MCSLLLLPVAWVPVPFGFRWSLPADSRSYEGLGGGIAWALDPAFCEQLLPSFHEDAPTSRYYRFVDCDEIKDRAAAFATPPPCPRNRWRAEREQSSHVQA